jgi:hypothetical protein
MCLQQQQQQQLTISSATNRVPAGQCWAEHCKQQQQPHEGCHMLHFACLL